MEIYKDVENGVQCILCPHNCILNKDNLIGKCKIREFSDNKIILNNYGRVTSIVIDPIEKKPFYYFYPDTKTLSIGSYGCNLSCVFCESIEISYNYNGLNTLEVQPLDIIDMAKKNSCMSICMSFNEPTISFEYLIELAKECKKNELKFILKTNAFVNKESWKEICKVTDAFNIDFKGSKENYKNICNVNKYVVLDRIKEVIENKKHLEISIPIHSDFWYQHNENSYLKDESVSTFMNFAEFLYSLDKYIACHILRVNCTGDNNIVSTPQNILEQIRDIFVGSKLSLVHIHKF